MKIELLLKDSTPSEIATVFAEQIRTRFGAKVERVNHLLTIFPSVPFKVEDLVMLIPVQRVNIITADTRQDRSLKMEHGIEMVMTKGNRFTVTLANETEAANRQIRALDEAVVMSRSC